MLSGSNNILDQLLGGFETTPFNVTGKPGQGTTGDSTGVMFGELLAGLMEDGQLIGDPKALQLGSCLFPSSDQPAAQDGAPAGQPSEIQSLIDHPVVPANTNQPFVLFAAAVTTAQTTSHPTVDATVAGDLTSLSAATPTPTDPVYNIIDFRIADGQVELTAATADQSAEPVQITIPVEVLGKALTEKINQLSNSETDPKSTAVRSLDSLLKASNLKTLTISQDLQATATSSHDTAAASAPVTATIVSENGGARFVITAKMDRQDLKMTSKANQTLDSELVLEDTEAGTENEVTSETPLRKRTETFELLPLKRNQAARFTLPERLGAEAKAFGSETDLNLTGLTSDRASQDGATTVRTTVPSAVKFTLPESLHRSFASSGQTVMLKIEPEHLGPARLNLSVRDQMLTARVTVDTPAAKLTVERSLDQLNDTLLRAGIDVDKIEVMLGDSGTREQFADHRPFWSQPRNVQKVTDADPFASDAQTMITPTLLSRQYVGNSGVNVLA